MRSRWNSALAFVCMMVLAGCASPLSGLKERSTLTTSAGPFSVEFATGDESGARKVRHAIEKASPQISRWSGLRDNVQVRVMPTHELLEDAVNRQGYAWLRAWARYDEVFIQTPRTWSLFGASQSDVDELMLHELTHCVMYQAAATRTNWTRKQIPLWFREGMASFTARQAYRWPSLEDVARYYDADPTRDPVGDPEALYQKDNDIVYASAHHAFTFLVKRYGEDRVREVLRNMASGNTFPEAFEGANGVTPEIFTSDFKRYVRLRGFRGGRKLRPPAPPALIVRPSDEAPRMEILPPPPPPGEPTFEESPRGEAPGCHYP